MKIAVSGIVMIISGLIFANRGLVLDDSITLFCSALLAGYGLYLLGFGKKLVERIMQ